MLIDILVFVECKEVFVNLGFMPLVLLSGNNHCQATTCCFIGSNPKGSGEGGDRDMVETDGDFVLSSRLSPEESIIGANEEERSPEVSKTPEEM